MMMPVMDGPALIAALRRLDERVPIVAASGLNSNGSVAKATSAGVRHFLAKPYNTQSLLKILKEVLADAPPRDAAGLPLRFLLAHGPDQFAWAQQNDFDLVLVGHNHGGQVRLPLLGAILAPSLSGTRYAGGVFRRGNTVMHVSRGTGSHTPLRWNCPPEVALLTLSQGHSGSA